MTKLMSLHLAYRAIEEGRLRKNQLIPIGRESSFKSSPPHSSLMFLEEGQRVTLLELMIGCAIPSGNDAATALAVAVSGSVDRFVAAMNREAAALGMTSTHFVEPSGYDEGNVTSAWDFARFCLVYIREHPEAIDELHALSQFTYPKASNIPEGGRSALGPITQTNHNNLVGRLEGVDGLKTGFIEESGYNIAVTASRNGRRLLAVLMGGPGETTGEGNLQRALDAAALLSYGFYRFGHFRSGNPVSRFGSCLRGGEKKPDPCDPDDSSDHGSARRGAGPPMAADLCLAGARSSVRGRPGWGDRSGDKRGNPRLHGTAGLRGGYSPGWLVPAFPGPYYRRGAQDLSLIPGYHIHLFR
jgi:D-alanyl-D-alanine carboxypeptidase